MGIKTRSIDSAYSKRNTFAGHSLAVQYLLSSPTRAVSSTEASVVRTRSDAF